MFYRIQTIYLFIVTLLSSLLSIKYFLKIYNKKYIYQKIFLYNYYNELIILLLIIIVLLTLYSITSFKKVYKQIYINNINIGINLNILIIIIYYNYKKNSIIEYIPFIILLIILIISNKLIKKDEKIIKSINKIR